MAVASYGGFSQNNLPIHSLPGLCASSVRDQAPGSIALPVMLSPSLYTSCLSLGSLFMYPAATRLRYSMTSNCQSAVSLPVGVRVAVDGPSASHLTAGVASREKVLLVSIILNVLSLMSQ
eukprot:559895-Prorocentrum_minimum.AAC.1